VGPCGYGTVFKLTPSGSGYTKTVLYNFCSQPYCTDGANPFAGLIDDASGNLYGTTYNGNANGGGTVFKLTPSGNGYALLCLRYSVGLNFHFVESKVGVGLETSGIRCGLGDWICPVLLLFTELSRPWSRGRGAVFD
jgi:uncharacterized repeat protein (TIGR03803 family)